MVKLEDYEKFVELCECGRPRGLLRRLYGQLTGGCFIDKNHRFEIDPKEALEAAEELYYLLGTFQNYFDKPPYDEDVYTESERNLLHEVLNEREDWD